MTTSGQICKRSYTILQYILQYGSAVLQYIAIHFLPYCFTPRNNGQPIESRMISVAMTINYPQVEIRPASDGTSHTLFSSLAR